MLGNDDRKTIFTVSIIACFLLLFWILPGSLLQFFFVAGMIGAIIYFVRKPKVLKRFYTRYVAPTPKNNARLRDELQIKLDTLRADMVDMIEDGNAFTAGGQEEQNEEIYQQNIKIELLTEQIANIDMMEQESRALKIEDEVRGMTYQEDLSGRLEQMAKEYELDNAEFKNQMKEKELLISQLRAEIEIEKEKSNNTQKGIELDFEEKRQLLRNMRMDRYVIKTNADIKLLLAEVDAKFRNAQTERESSEAKFIRHVLTTINILDMSEELQAYIVATVFNKGNSSGYDEYKRQQSLQEINELKAKAEARKTYAEADKITSDTNYKDTETEGLKTQNKHEEWKHEETKRERS